MKRLYNFLENTRRSLNEFLGIIVKSMQAMPWIFIDKGNIVVRPA